MLSGWALVLRAREQISQKTAEIYGVRLGDGQGF